MVVILSLVAVVSNIVPSFALRPALSYDLILSTAASSSRLLMKSGHSIPKIQGLCNWSGSTVCLCEHRFV